MKYKNLSEKVSIFEVKKEIGSFFKLIDWASSKIDGLSKQEAGKRERLNSIFNNGYILLNSSFSIQLNYYYELFSGKFKKEKFASIVVEENLFKLHFDYFGDNERRKIFETPEDALNKMKNDLFFMLEDFVKKNNKKIRLFMSKVNKERFAFLTSLLDKKEDVKLSDFLNVEVKKFRDELILVPLNWKDLFVSEKHDLHVIDVKGEIEEIYSDIYSVFIDQETQSLRIKFESSENNIIGSFNDYAFDEKTERFSFDNSNELSAKKYLTLEEAREELKNIIGKMKKELEKLEEK